MKTTLFAKAASVAALLLLSATANAKSWRIHNDAKKKAHFTDINAAMASEEVQAGDTLYLDPGCTLLSAQTISKAVTIIGNGYFLQNGMVAATINADVTINAANAKLMGVSISGTVRLDRYGNNVTLERCKLSTIYTYRVIYGLTILQCYIVSSSSSGALYGSTSYPFRNATIKNNIIRWVYESSSASHGVIEYVYDSEIANNYIAAENIKKGYHVLRFITGCQIYNNIIRHVYQPDAIYFNTDGDSNNAFYNNVISAADGAYPNATDIVYLAGDFSTVFAEGAEDAAFRLKEDSPAKGAAADGGDCGPYGGVTPYVEGGKPLYHPFINDVRVTAKPVDGKVKLTLNAKMQNE